MSAARTATAMVRVRVRVMAGAPLINKLRETLIVHTLVAAGTDWGTKPVARSGSVAAARPLRQRSSRESSTAVDGMLGRRSFPIPAATIVDPVPAAGGRVHGSSAGAGDGQHPRAVQTEAKATAPMMRITFLLWVICRLPGC